MANVPVARGISQSFVEEFLMVFGTKLTHSVGRAMAKELMNEELLKNSGGGPTELLQ